eukprot:TRINITY_DN28168_c0_g2_i1.p1 TRINITY_DN28168_c0_g2~~TRINITY_DN28168_c0_g2_i1.p1  ORF type:complete len:222 (+),score=47.59 TRINITY_DN28168_c0_g2_i1:49-714(+)
MDFAEEALDAVGDAVGGGVGLVLGPILSAMSEPALQVGGESAGRLAVTKMCEKFPNLEAMSPVLESAVNDAINTAAGFAGEICEWIDRIGEDPMEAFHAVGVLILRAVRAACQAAVSCCLNAIAGCLEMLCPCCCNPDCTSLVDDVCAVVDEQMKQWCRDQLAERNLPSAIVDMLDFGFSEYDDIEPRRESEPEMMVMGCGYENQQDHFEQKDEFCGEEDE